MTARRGASVSPWYGANQVPRRAQASAPALLPASSWWVTATEHGRFYEEARAQLPRLIETAGRAPLKGRTAVESAA